MIVGLVLFSIGALVGSQVPSVKAAIPAMILVGLGNACPTALTIPLLSLSRRHDCLTIDEFADMESRDSPDLLFNIKGYGVAPGAFFAGNRNNNDWGWTIGGGVEYAFTNNLTVKLEGLYVNFDNGRNNDGFFGNGIVGVSNTGAAITQANFGLFGNRDNNNDFFIVRAGINYKFGTF